MFFYFQRVVNYGSFPPTDTDGLITQALLTGNFEAAVDVCLHADRMVSSIVNGNVIVKVNILICNSGCQSPAEDPCGRAL